MSGRGDELIRQWYAVLPEEYELRRAEEEAYRLEWLRREQLELLSDEA